MNNAIITEHNVTFFSSIKKEMITISSKEACFDAIKTMVLNQEDEEKILIHFDKSKNAIVKFSKDKIEIKNDKLYFNGAEIHHVVVSKIIELKLGGYSFEHMLSFLENLYNNPSIHSRRSLYEFLEKHNMPITEDGCFLAYKGVNNDYTDSYTNKIDNSIGQVIKMNRDDVVKDSNQPCGAGLHCGAKKYLIDYLGFERSMIVKVNPKDVVSVPNDCNFTKMRTCEYEVIDETFGLLKHEMPIFTDKKGKKKTSLIKVKAKFGTKWQQWEDKYLVKHYKTNTKKEISKQLNRTVKACQERYALLKRKGLI